MRIDEVVIEIICSWWLCWNHTLLWCCWLDDTQEGRRNKFYCHPQCFMDMTWPNLEWFYKSGQVKR